MTTMACQLAAVAVAMETGLTMRIDHTQRPTLREVGPPRILIVEDDVHLADNLRELVELLGYHAIALTSAEEALVEVAEARVDFVVTDLRLPGMSGAEFLISLRALGKNIPSVITTAWILDAEAEAFSHSNETEILSKPIDIQRLVSLMRGALEPRAQGIVLSAVPRLGRWSGCSSRR